MNNEGTEFSKLLLKIIFAVAGIIIVFCLVMIWRTNDTSAFAYLIPAIFVEVATATGFYYWKAKAENIIKLKQAYPEVAVEVEQIEEEII